MGVDDPMELFVVNQQIDELCDLEVIGPDLWLAQRSNDQVLLLRVFSELYVLACCHREGSQTRQLV
jgi:hypothetical protein